MRRGFTLTLCHVIRTQLQHLLQLRRRRSLSTNGCATSASSRRRSIRHRLRRHRVRLLQSRHHVHFHCSWTGPIRLYHQHLSRYRMDQSECHGTIRLARASRLRVTLMALLPLLRPSARTQHHKVLATHPMAHSQMASMYRLHSHTMASHPALHRQHTCMTGSLASVMSRSRRRLVRPHSIRRTQRQDLRRSPIFLHSTSRWLTACILRTMAIHFNRRRTHQAYHSTIRNIIRIFRLGTHNRLPHSCRGSGSRTIV